MAVPPAEQKKILLRAGNRCAFPGCNQPLAAEADGGGPVAVLESPDFRARRVADLSGNPLLLTNLCLVHRDRGALPRARAQLYAECVDVLLERWRSSKDLAVGVTVLSRVNIHTSTSR